MSSLQRFCILNKAKQSKWFLQGFFRHNKIMPPYFLFSLRRGISRGVATPNIRSLKKIKKGKKAVEKNTPLKKAGYFLLKTN